MSSNASYSNEPRPRLCHLRRWPDFLGYGFNLHCEKSKPGQFIGKVDADSPAEAAGLRENDRIIEVNSMPIGADNHKQVVTRIKEGVMRNGKKYDDEVMLLVLDPIADEYYKKKSTIVRSTDPNVEKHETPSRGDKENTADNSSRSSDGSDDEKETSMPRQTQPPAPIPDYKRATDHPIPTVSQIKSTNSPAISRASDRADTPPNDDDQYLPASPPASNKSDQKVWSAYKPQTVANPSPTPSPKDFYAKPVDTNSTKPSSTNGSAGVFELKMSAAEYRQKLKAQSARKRDPRQDTQMSMKEKHDFIERL